MAPSRSAELCAGAGIGAERHEVVGHRGHTPFVNEQPGDAVEYRLRYPGVPRRHHRQRLCHRLENRDRQSLFVSGHRIRETVLHEHISLAQRLQNRRMGLGPEEPHAIPEIHLGDVSLRRVEQRPGAEHVETQPITSGGSEPEGLQCDQRCLLTYHATDSHAANDVPLGACRRLRRHVDAARDDVDPLRLQSELNEPAAGAVADGDQAVGTVVIHIPGSPGRIPQRARHVVSVRMHEVPRSRGTALRRATGATTSNTLPSPRRYCACAGTA